MTSQSIRSLAAALVACATVTLRGAEPAQHTTDVAALSFAQAICEFTGGSGPTFTVSGPRLQWTGSVDPAVAENTALKIINAVREQPSFAVGAAGNWVVVNDLAIQRATLLNCSTKNSVVRAVGVGDFRAQLALSEFGDLAIASVGGTVLVWGMPAREPLNVEPALLSSSGRTGGPALVWSERRLLLIGDIESSAVSVGTDDVLGVRAPLTIPDDAALNRKFSSAPGGFVRAFAYNGQFFAMRADGCFDLFAGRTLSPRIREVGCLPERRDPESYVEMDRESARVFGREVGDGSFAVRWSGPRVLGVSGRVDGTTTAITQTIGNIEALHWLSWDTMPFGRDRRGSSTVPLTSQWSDAYRGTNELAQRGYKQDVVSAQFPTDKGWLVNGSVAVRWQTGLEYISSSDAPLSKVAAERYPEGRYRDADLTDILTFNSSLARSLEGLLFKAGALPIGVFYGPENGPPAALASSSWLKTASVRRQLASAAAVKAAVIAQSNGQCSATGPAPDASLTRALQKGVSVVGGVVQLPPAGLRLRAEHAEFVVCAGSVRLLLLSGVAFRTDESPSSAILNQFSHPSPTGIVFHEMRDEDWPWAVQEPVVAGIQFDDDSAGTQARSDGLRTWLDGVLAPGFIDRLLVPVSYLDVLFAADTSWPEKASKVSGVTFLSGERVPASARAVAPAPCLSADDAVASRAIYEHLVGLKHSSAEVENTYYVGVVENAVRGDDTRFVDGVDTIWRMVDAQRHLVALDANALRDMSQDAPALWHGTAVAALIYSGLAPPGLLLSPRLVWVDASKPDFGLLQRLSGERHVVNVSQELAEGWEPVLEQTKDSGVLIVAAAHNASQRDGNPLAMKLPNVIGVGAVDKDGNTPPSLLQSYDRTHVDLLAPAFHVAVADAVEPACVDGTSFATPYVTAVSSLLSSRTMASATQIKARLLATATWRDELGPYVRGGVLNAERALGNVTKDVITFEDPADPTKPGLIAHVELAETSFVADGFKGGHLPAERNGALKQTMTFSWNAGFTSGEGIAEVLRLTRTKPRPDVNGRLRPAFRIVYVQQGTYGVLDDASIGDAQSALPIVRCHRLADDVPVACGGASVDLVQDFVRRMVHSPVNAF